MQADSWHTNAAGYELIANAVLRILKRDERVMAYLDRLKQGRRDAERPAPEAVPGHRF